MSRTLFIFIILSICLISISASAQSSKLFWIDQSSHKIFSANLNGTAIKDVMTDVDAAEGLAIDTSVIPMKIYYSEAGRERIVRMNFDGTDQEEIITGITGLEEIDLDLVNRKIYWFTDIYSLDMVMRADMDGLNSNIDTIYSSSYAMHGFNGIAVDPISQCVFWSQTVYGSVDRINRINYDKTNRKTLGNYLSPRDIDVVGDSLYWIWAGYDHLMKSDLNGENVDTVLAEIYGHFFVVERQLRKIFWTEPNKICCSNLDGTEVMVLIPDLGYFLRSIAVYYNPNATALTEINKFPSDFQLKQNYPNPFNPMTTIEFSIPNSGFVSLKIYNVLGQHVVTLINQNLKPGTYTQTWNAAGFASGVYFYKLESGNITKTRKLFLLQ